MDTRRLQAQRGLEMPELSANDRRLKAYHIARDKAEDTPAGQFELAQWCAKRGLEDQERAHLTRVLEIDPNHAEARERLGFRRVDGVWLSDEEVEAARVRGRDAMKAFAKWRPKIERIRQGLHQRSLARQDAARKQLREITDPAAIPALEQVLSGDSAELALAVIKTIAKFEIGKYL